MVNFVGMKELGLTETEEKHAHTIVERHLLRVYSLTDDVIDARVRVKRSNKRGPHSRYEVNVAVLSASGARYATSSSWEISTAIHHAFESIENQLENKRDFEKTGHAEVWNYSNPVI